jgi:D-alanyl-D-alanine carboxypeptidase (penicillin-binding protein 5/6)
VTHPRAAVAAVVLAVVALLAPAAGAQERPRLSAASAIAIEASTGQVAFARAPARARPIASATKLMTALLTVEGTQLGDVLTAAPYAANPAESLAGLRPGERATVRDLLEGLLLASGNDAAVTLAVGVAGTERAFVRRMNARARELGLRETRFVDPVGLGAGNVSSARDLVRLARAARRDAFLRRTMNRPRASIITGGRRRTVQNRNLLVREVGFVDGVKTGRTLQAGYVLVGSGTRRGVTVLTAVLGEPSEQARMTDTLRLLRYGLARYARATLVRRGAPVGRAGLRHREGESVPLVAGATVRRVVRRGASPQVRLVRAPAELDGPLAAGARVGEAEVRLRGRVVQRVPVVTGAAVAEATTGQRVGGALGGAAVLVVVVAVAVCSLLLALVRRRVGRRAVRSR